MHDVSLDIPAIDEVIFQCRFCGTGVRAPSRRHLPETCVGCNATTWDDEGHCGSGDCDATRRPGVRGRAHCAVCGYSIWSATTPTIYTS